MGKELTQSGIVLLRQIKYLIGQLSDDNYAYQMDLLSGNTLGKHIRHVLEIYNELIKGMQSGSVNYDNRQRNLLLENNCKVALKFTDELIGELSNIVEDRTLKLEVCFNLETRQTMLETTLYRELAYNIEHATHHMAILQIAVKYYFPTIRLVPSFGIASSTQSYLQHVHS